jgi:hypothetical protein
VSYPKSPPRAPPTSHAGADAELLEEFAEKEREYQKIRRSETTLNWRTWIMLLGPLQHQRLAKYLRKKVSSLPLREKALKRAGYHQWMAQLQARDPSYLPKSRARKASRSS